jgi:hypothetical protein
MQIIINMENTNTEGTTYMVKGPSEKIYYKTEFGKCTRGCNWEFYKRIFKKRGALSKDNAMCKNKRG